jgi:hypothetical protein
VSCSAGNAGPDSSTLSIVAPWITTVGAGILDRDFPVSATARTETSACSGRSRRRRSPVRLSSTTGASAQRSSVASSLDWAAQRCSIRGVRAPMAARGRVVGGLRTVVLPSIAGELR